MNAGRIQVNWSRPYTQTASTPLPETAVIMRDPVVATSVAEHHLARIGEVAYMVCLLVGVNDPRRLHRLADRLPDDLVLDKLGADEDCGSASSEAVLRIS